MITDFFGHTVVRRASVFGIAAEALASAARSLMAAWRQARDIEHLESMSDGQLRDIGITRSQIALVVRGTNIDHLRGRHVVD